MARAVYEGSHCVLSRHRDPDCENTNKANKKAHRLLDRLLLRKTVDPMNLNDNDLAPTGATTVKVPSGSVKETDSWTNANIRGDQDIFSCLVVESGMSESLNQLRCDAKWWMESSARRVNIVLIIWISRALRALHIEKYVPGFSQTRTSPRLARPVAATRTATVVIDCLAEPIAVTGAPMVLEFNGILDRLPGSPLERDVVFSLEDLQPFGDNFWVGL